MKNAFLELPKKILQEWKNLRRQLVTDLSDEVHLSSVTNFWSQSPVMCRHLIDWDNPQSWPDPWNMINDNSYDDDMIALGMFYTLIYAEDNRWQGRVYLALASDIEKTFQHLVVVVDNQQLLNVQYNDIVEYSPKQITIHQRYQYIDKIHSQFS